MRISDWSSDVCSSELGAPTPRADVPDRLVRLRLVNGSNARIYELSFSDDRTFHWIGTEGGLLARSVELQALTLAPGQRAEILVSFADGKPVALVTAQDASASMMGMMGGTGMMGDHHDDEDDASTTETVLTFRSEEHKSELQSLMRI